MIGFKLKTAALLATLVLAGCGGSDDSGAGRAAPASASADALGRVPGSAQGDSAGLLAYREVLGAKTGEDSEPVNLDAFVSTRSEDSEPLELH